MKNIYFLGIGGIGMSGLARYFLKEGCNVWGYDLTASDITHHLEELGAKIHYEEDVEQIPARVDFVVYTPAVPKAHKEYQFFMENQVPVYKRSQVLGMISAKLPTIGVAGTHGKTTTTSMLTTLLHGDYPLLAFIGGIAKNFNANVIVEDNPALMTVEADEFDRSFLTLYPKVGVITSMDADHLDIYGQREQLVVSFQQYAQQVSGSLVVHEAIADQLQHGHKLVYGLQPHCDYYASDIQLMPNAAAFTLHYAQQSIAVSLSVPGLYNVLNAVAAFAAAREFGMLTGMNVDERLMAQRLGLFVGVKRRFDYRINRPDFVYIDDFAHHPEELRSFITAVKKIYPNKHICGIFQPHLYTRTRDFAPQFAEVLSALDTVILMDIFPARELPIPGITSQYLLGIVESPQKVLLSKEEIVPYLKIHCPDILLTMGAGNIDRLVPKIEAAFQQNLKK